MRPALTLVSCSAYSSSPNEGDKFFRSVGQLSTDYTAVHPKRSPRNDLGNESSSGRPPQAAPHRPVRSCAVNSSTSLARARCQLLIKSCVPYSISSGAHLTIRMETRVYNFQLFTFNTHQRAANNITCRFIADFI